MLAVLTLRQQFAGTGADAETLTIAGQTLVAFHDWTFLLGPGFCAGIGNGLLLGYMMYASGLLPRRLAAFGMVAGSVRHRRGHRRAVRRLRAPVRRRRCC